MVFVTHCVHLAKKKFPPPVVTVGYRAKSNAFWLTNALVSIARFIYASSERLLDVSNHTLALAMIR